MQVNACTLVKTILVRISYQFKGKIESTACCNTGQVVDTKQVPFFTKQTANQSLGFGVMPPLVVPVDTPLEADTSSLAKWYRHFLLEFSP